PDAHGAARGARAGRRGHAGVPLRRGRAAAGERSDPGARRARPATLVPSLAGQGGRRRLEPLAGRAFLLLQRMLPQHLLTALVRRLAQVRAVPVKDFLIRTFVRAYAVELEDVAQPVPDGFEHFNAFFTRELAPGARPVDPAPDAIVSPVDGTTSAAGRAARG